MPYTPPTQRSPATSKPSSPSLTRSHSYANDRPSPSLSATSPRPGYSRSYSYSQKHRRSPSISDSSQDVSKSTAEITAENVAMGNGAADRGLRSVGHGIMSPPESLHSSDEEERGRSRQLAELQSALQNIDLNPKRGYSPTRTEEDSAPAAPHPTPSALGSASPALTPEARKISHSRSSSDIHLSTKMNQLDNSPIQSTDGSESDDEDGLRIKPPLLRKKSGELVKPALRPSSRRRPSSMPGTPTYSKAVHFDEDIEQVRHFLQVDRPIAVSAGSSPVETYESESEYPFNRNSLPKARVIEWDIKLADFPNESFERATLPIRVEKIFLSSDNNTLIGEVACQNLAFQKLVVARFTLDYWKTTSEVVAEYSNDVRRKQTNDGCDRFNFNIRLSDQANLESKTLLLCVRYNVSGQEYWDSNNGMNYQVDFIKKTKSKNVKGGMQGFSAGTLGAIPRSRHHPPRSRTSPATPDDDFAQREDSSYDFLQSPHSISRLKQSSRGRKASTFPDQPISRPNASSQGLSNRYDFAASLSAALGNAQTAMGDRSGLKPMERSKPTITTARTSTVSEPSVPADSADARRLDALSSDKPDLQSAEYHELIQKYCFFGSEKASGKNSPVVKTPSKPAPATDGTTSENESENNSAQNSGSDSPSPNAMPPLLDGANDPKSSSCNVSPFLSRSTSPGPVTGFTPRAASPGAFPPPYRHQTMHGGFDFHTPTAIRG